MTNIPFMVSARSASAFINGRQYTANNTHMNFNAIVEALRTGDFTSESLIHLFDVAKAVEAKAFGKVKIENGVVYYNGSPVHTSLTRRLLQMIEEGFDVEPLMKFLDNLFLNPSYRCVQSVYDFAEANNCPITPDGGMLMFKKVRADYLDIHSRTVLNKPSSAMTEDEIASFPKVMGNNVTVAIENNQTVISVPRNLVDEDIDQTCSHGLHVCAEHYLPNFSSHDRSDRVLIVKVFPSDIVANPRDYRNAKLRVCRYEIVGELPKEKASTYFTAPVMDGTESWDTPVAPVTPSYNEEVSGRIHTVTFGDTVVTFTEGTKTGDWIASWIDEYGDDCEVDFYGDYNEVVEEFRETYVHEFPTYKIDWVALDENFDRVTGTVEFTEEDIDLIDIPLDADDINDGCADINLPYLINRDDILEDTIKATNVTKITYITKVFT